MALSYTVRAALPENYADAPVADEPRLSPDFVAVESRDTVTARSRTMGKRLDPITKANKNVAEFLFGHAPGRPTISRRVGGGISDVLPISEDAAVHLFHLVLAAGAGVLLKRVIK